MSSPAGYRLVYRGDVLERDRSLRPFTAATEPFEVT